ncbi:histidine phosphatase family protein [Aminobacterium mobile]|jgi:broad specificity phosphatase PhoE|uniref:histidine phosphatase family protein n=1 Tax=Aminobacterium mobile TaxID=81467 RepID=UPI0004657813|nr:histidine phosphatase family protein [Aminobacterium mobile]
MATDREHTTIILARHGECQGNREERFRGRVDYPLNERGLEQAEDLGKAIAPMVPDFIYTSPLLRAKQTATAIARACSHKHLFECEGLNNINFSFWEGRLKKEIALEYPSDWETWLTYPEKLRLFGAETLQEVQGRALRALKELVEKHYGDTIVVVSHRTVLKPLIAGCLNIPEPYFWKTHMDTASYSILTYDYQRGYGLFSLNQTAHLKKVSTEWI